MLPINTFIKQGCRCVSQSVIRKIQISLSQNDKIFPFSNTLPMLYISSHAQAAKNAIKRNSCRHLMWRKRSHQISRYCTTMTYSTTVNESTLNARSSSNEPDLQHAPLHFDIDIGSQLHVNCLETLRANLASRKMDFDLDTLIHEYQALKEIEEKKVNLEKERTQIAKEMASLVKSKFDIKSERGEKLMRRGKEVKDQLKEVMAIWREAEEKVSEKVLKLPVDLHHLTPLDREQVIKSYDGTVQIPDLPVSHIIFAEELGLLKFSSVGLRSVYFLGELVELEIALGQYACNKMDEHKFIPIAGPEIFRTLVVKGCGLDSSDPKTIYTLQPKDEDIGKANAYHLKGTSLLSFAAFLASTQLREESLPLMMYSFGRHYQPVSDPDMPGLYGAVQSNRVAMFAACKNYAEASEIHTSLTQVAWEIVQDLGLPSRLVSIASSALAPAESLRTEVQVWAPSLKQYVQVGHVSNHGDYVSRRLQSKYTRDFMHTDSSYLHMTSGVAMDITRLLAVIMEYSYTEGKYKMLHIPCLDTYRAL